MTDKELTEFDVKMLVDEAYDRYLDVLAKLAFDHGFAPASSREVQDDPRTRAAAAQAYAAFSREQDEINAQYFAPRDAHALAKEKAKEEGNTHAVLCSQAQGNLEQAESNLDREDQRITAMRHAGIEVTDAEATEIIARAQGEVDHWQSEADKYAALPLMTGRSNER